MSGADQAAAHDPAAYSDAAPHLPRDGIGSSGPAVRFNPRKAPSATPKGTKRDGGLSNSRWPELADTGPSALMLSRASDMQQQLENKRTAHIGPGYVNVNMDAVTARPPTARMRVPSDLMLKLDTGGGEISNSHSTNFGAGAPAAHFAKVIQLAAVGR